MWTELNITHLLNAWRAGEAHAGEQLIAALYPILRKQAAARLHRIGPGQLSLSATELAHETYLRMLDQRGEFVSRTHFLAIVAQTLRRVIADLLRERATLKRGRSDAVISIDQLDPDQIAEVPQPLDIAEFIQSLEILERRDAIAARVIELRFFGGLTALEAAEVLGIGVATANRHFAFARAWLTRRAQ